MKIIFYKEDEEKKYIVQNSYNSKISIEFSSESYDTVVEEFINFWKALGFREEYLYEYFEEHASIHNENIKREYERIKDYEEHKKINNEDE